MFLLERRRERKSAVWVFVPNVCPQNNSRETFALLLCRILLFWGDVADGTMINLLADACASDGAALTGRNGVEHL